MGAKSAAAPRPGEVFQEKFRVLRVVGEGGMGVVFAAHHLLLDCPVAIKLLSPEVAAQPENVARLVNEARLAARIKNEHVCQVLDVGKLDERPYLVMELLDGSDLSAVLRERGPLPVPEVVGWMLQAIEGLAHAHAHGVVHRDLKPSNLFLTRKPGSSGLVKVLDFGISKVDTALTMSGGMTSTRAILGSPAYMAPEQIKDARDVDVRADVWSLGVIMYELLTGICPFDAETSGAIFARVLGDGAQPPPVSASRADCPPVLDAVIARCLRKARDERFENVYELASAIADLAPYDAEPHLHGISDALERTAVKAVPEPISSQSLAQAHPTNVTWAAGSRTHASITRGVALGVGGAIVLLAAIGAAVLAAGRLRGAPSAAGATASHAPPLAAVDAPDAVPAPPAAYGASAVPPADVDLLPPPEIISSSLAPGARTPPPRPARPHAPPTKQELLKDRR